MICFIPEDLHAIEIDRTTLEMCRPSREIFSELKNPPIEFETIQAIE